MFDSRPVTTDMEALFGRPACPRTGAAIVSATPFGPTAPGRHWPFTATDGMATIAFAITAALIGMVALPLLKPSTPVDTRVSQQHIAAPVVIRSPSAIMTPVTAPVIAAPTVTSPPRRSAKRKPAVRHHLAAVRKTRPASHPRGTPGAPYLTGAALRRALAKDAIVTRRLNLEALRKLPPA